MPYYYSCCYPLGAGSIVKRGNWGRISKLDSFLPQGKPNLALMLDLVFENIRLKEFPDRPSRLDSIFVCPNEASIRGFVRTRPYDLVYEVELVDEHVETFETGWTLYDPNICVNGKLETIQQAARLYWSPHDIPDTSKETIVNGDIRIVRQL